MDTKPPELEKHFIILELLFSTLPYVFWKSRDGKYQGGNQNQAMNFGFSSPADFIGKTIYEVLEDQIAAADIDAVDQKIMEDDKTLIIEEKLLTSKGEKFYHTQKSPIHNKNGEVIGLLGFSMDITELKKQEITITEERDRLIKIAAQVAHDINSPLAALRTMIDVCNELPENKRSLLKRATENILDIGNNLLNNYRKKEESALDIESRQPLLVSNELSLLLSEKRAQYQQCPVRFETTITSEAQFSFINVQKTEFQRAMSNIINNAVDALKDNKQGVITIQLTADDYSVIVQIKDNGKGMSEDNIKKLSANQSFTEGKENGHGLGLQQVGEMLKYNEGAMAVQSTLGKGTSFQLTFSRVAASNWIAQKIHLSTDKIIVVLDDDESIHTAWNLRLTPFLNLHSTLCLYHFTQGKDVLNFLNKLSPEEKDRVTFLSDYELLHQDRNGLQIIEISQIKEAMLVTSYYSNPKVLEAAARLKIKILPKQMASVIPIVMDLNTQQGSFTKTQPN